MGLAQLKKGFVHIMQRALRQIELNAVLRTAQLHHRQRRRPDYEAESRALLSLAQMLANPPRDILQRLVDAALDLCQGGSAGISIIEDHLGEKVFRWHALAGALAAHKWGTTPRDFSPCGTVIDRNAVQLMHLPERHFLYLTNVKPQVVEVLLVPFSVNEQPVGTIWVVSHDEARQFDAEDERLVRELGQLATIAYQFASSVQTSKIHDRRKDAFLATLACELRNPLLMVDSANTPVAGCGHSTDESRQQGTSESSEHRLKSLKRVINDLMDRLTSSFESISVASGLSMDDPLSVGGQGICAQVPIAPRAVAAARRDLKAVGSFGGASRVTLARSALMPMPHDASGDCGRNPAVRSSRGQGVPTADAVALLARMRRGDQRALEELYESTVGSVYALALAILRSAEDAEEVVGDTYARAWRQSERFDAERASPVGWLMMMCRSRAIDRLRHNRARRVAKTVDLESVGDLAHDAMTPDEVLALFHSGSRVQIALATLGPQRLKLVGFAFFEGLSFPQIAERTGMPLGTVKSHIRRALVDLRRQLQSSDGRAL